MKHVIVFCIFSSTIGLISLTNNNFAHAGTKIQGTKIQGTKIQGTKTAAIIPAAALRDNWLDGSPLFGTMSMPIVRGLSLVVLADFLGHSIAAIVWDLNSSSLRDNSSRCEWQHWSICAQGYDCTSLRRGVTKLLQ